MTALVWDEVGERFYETGVDRGVIYLPDDTAVPWNGLTSVTEKPNKEVSSAFYDGMKISDFAVSGHYEAVLKAITYPKELELIEGNVEVVPGMLLSDQMPQTFGLSYRTMIGNDVEGTSAGYRIHIVYYVTATPSDKTFDSISNDPSFVEFEWDITAIPVPVENARPTAHVSFDSRDLDPELLSYIEDILYGTVSTSPTLMPLSELITFVQGFYGIVITDNGDGTWTAYTGTDSNIEFSGVDLEQFTIFNANAVYLDADTYEISTTVV